MSEEVSSLHVESACSGMVEARAGGGNVLAVILGGLKSLIGLGLSKETIIAILSAAWDRLTEGDSPYIPGDGNDPNSFEAKLEAKGRELIPLIVPVVL